MREQQANLKTQLADVKDRIDDYERLKRVLACQSNPLVVAVSDILTKIFELKVNCDDIDRMEDIRILDHNDKVIGLIEVKGIVGNFRARDISQVILHRDRRELPTSTPSILILNSTMKATSIECKDEPPHGDMIKHAVKSEVLIMRTLDLLRFVKLIEQQSASADDFRKVLFGSAGWLRVGDDAYEVVTA